MEDSVKNSRPHVICLAVCAFIFVCMMLFPSLSTFEPLRAIFREWTYVAIELLLFISIIAILTLGFLADPSRRDKDGNVNFSWPP
ncbi:MAG: hypothetical protein WCW31_04945 [Patescibacteria group bacterium]